MDKIILKHIVIDAPVENVWKTITDPQLMKNWIWEEEVNIFSDWKPGSLIEFKGTFHGADYTDRGIIQHYQPNTLFQYNYWSHLSQLPDEAINYQKIRFELSESNKSTKPSLTCSNNINAAIYGH